MHAQNREDLLKQNFSKCIKWNPVSLSIGALSVHYEKINSNDKSLMYYGNIFKFLYQNRILGFGLGAGYRSYFTDNSKSDFYIEPFIKYQFIQLMNTNWNLNTFGLGLIAGRKWILGERITMEVYGGPLYSFGFNKVGSNPSLPYIYWLPSVNGIWLKSGLAFGYRY